MEYTKENVVKIVEDFKDLIVAIEMERRIRYDAVHESDCALGDIRHFCELSYPTERSTRTKVCQLMRDISKKRRNDKDFLDVTQPLADFLSNSQNSQNLKGNLGKAANNMKKALVKTQGERVYVPRVLNDLFKKEI